MYVNKDDISKINAGNDGQHQGTQAMTAGAERRLSE